MGKTYRQGAADALIGWPAMAGLDAVQADRLQTQCAGSLSNRLHSSCKVLCSKLWKDPHTKETWQRACCHAARGGGGVVGGGEGGVGGQGGMGLQRRQAVMREATAEAS